MHVKLIQIAANGQSTTNGYSEASWGNTWCFELLQSCHFLNSNQLIVSSQLQISFQSNTNSHSQPYVQVLMSGWLLVFSWLLVFCQIFKAAEFPLFQNFFPNPSVHGSMSNNIISLKNPSVYMFFAIVIGFAVLNNGLPYFPAARDINSNYH